MEAAFLASFDHQQVSSLTFIRPVVSGLSRFYFSFVVQRSGELWVARVSRSQPVCLNYFFASLSGI
jgi:hypothetical protein